MFSLTDPAKVQIEIKEMGIRVITLSTDEKVEARKLYAILVKLEKLLQIFDGAFVPLEGIVLHGEEEEKISDICDAINSTKAALLCICRYIFCT